jgi:glyoxylase-like metal-dependent hydrolase (beta-lactamase superfamily II)
VVDECWSDEEDMSDSGPYEVIIIKEGFSNPLSSENQFHTGASITLLKGPMSIIVDTGHPKDRDLILQGLETNGVLASDVECCISTHSHVDHIGNLNIFQDAVHVTCVRTYVCVTFIISMILDQVSRSLWPMM